MIYVSVLHFRQSVDSSLDNDWPFQLFSPHTLARALLQSRSKEFRLLRKNATNYKCFFTQLLQEPPKLTKKKNKTLRFVRKNSNLLALLLAAIAIIVPVLYSRTIVIVENTSTPAVSQTTTTTTKTWNTVETWTIELSTTTVVQDTKNITLVTNSK